MMPWILISVAVLLVILGLLVFLVGYARKGGHFPPPDYYSMFVMGIIWVGFGAASMLFYGTEMLFFLGMGVVFSVAGLAHRKEWKKNHRTWKQLSRQEQMFKMIVIIGLGVLLLIGLIALFIVQMTR